MTEQISRILSFSGANLVYILFSMKEFQNPASKNKNKSLTQLSDAVFFLEESKGHLKWKVTDLSRKSKLSRSLIYQYLGSSKKEILVSAFGNFIADFYGFENSGKAISFWEQIKIARQRMIQNPEAIIFYQKWRTKDSWLRNEFIQIEKKFQARLKKAFPHLTELQVISLHASIHGIVTAPFLDPEQAQEILKVLWGTRV